MPPERAFDPLNIEWDRSLWRGPRTWRALDDLASGVRLVSTALTPSPPLVPNDHRSAQHHAHDGILPLTISQREDRRDQDRNAEDGDRVAAVEAIPRHTCFLSGALAEAISSGPGTRQARPAGGLRPGLTARA